MNERSETALMIGATASIGRAISRKLADGAEVTVWRGRNTGHFEEAAYLLAWLAGKTLQLELFDAEVGGWGHIMLDHVRLGQLEAAQ